jgi:hypothetical protein
MLNKYLMWESLWLPKAHLHQSGGNSSASGWFGNEHTHQLELGSSEVNENPN